MESRSAQSELSEFSELALPKDLIANRLVGLLSLDGYLVVICDNFKIGILNLTDQTWKIVQGAGYLDGLRGTGFSSSGSRIGVTHCAKLNNNRFGICYDLDNKSYFVVGDPKTGKLEFSPYYQQNIGPWSGPRNQSAQSNTLLQIDADNYLVAGFSHVHIVNFKTKIAKDLHNYSPEIRVSEYDGMLSSGNRVVFHKWQNLYVFDLAHYNEGEGWFSPGHWKLNKINVVKEGPSDFYLTHMLLLPEPNKALISYSYRCKEYLAVIDLLNLKSWDLDYIDGFAKHSEKTFNATKAIMLLPGSKYCVRVLAGYEVVSTVEIWDLTTEKCVHSHLLPDLIGSVILTSDLNLLMTHYDNKITKYSLAEVIPTLEAGKEKPSQSLKQLLISQGMFKQPEAPEHKPNCLEICVKRVGSWM